MSHEDIAHLLKLLETSRSRLRIVLQNIKQVGPGTSAISLQLEIDTIRAEIRTYKQQLRDLGQVVEDSIVDTATNEAQLRILNLPTDYVPEPKPLPARSRMHLFANPLFVGREQELMRIASDMQMGGSSAIVAITGMGGMGKTQLASEFVHRYGHYFAGGVYWLSFAEPAGIEAEIVACGTAMDLANFAELKFPEQVQLVQQAWQQQVPRLLVFDNCEDEALLQKYLPKGSACQVLITSRRQYRDTKLPLAKVRLARLPRHQSIALLRQFRPDLTEQNPDLLQIAEKLGDWPLALHVAGSYLKRYARKISPTQYLEKLQQAPLQSFAVRALEDTPTEHERDLVQTLMVSYQQLEPTVPTDGLSLQILNYAAHLAPDEPINLDFLEKLIEEHITELDDELVFEDAIARLEELGLIEREEQDAIRLHSLISAFILELNTDSTVQATIEQYFLRVSDKSYHEQFLALRYNLNHLRYTTNQAYERADTQAARLQAILAHCLRFSYDNDGALNHYHQAQELFQALDQRLGLANTLRSIGDVLYRRNDNDGALNHYHQAQELFQALDQRLGLANTLDSIGDVLYQRNDYGGALNHYYQAQELFQALDNHLGLANSLYSIGDVLLYRNDNDGALNHYHQAQELYQALDNHLGLANTLKSIGDVLYQRNDNDGALNHYHQAKELFQAINDRLGLANTLKSIGDVLLYRNDNDGALNHYHQSKELFQAINDRLGLANTLASRGEVALANGDQELADDLLQQAIDIYQQIGNRYSIAAKIGNYGWALRRHKRYQEAKPYLLRAADLFEQINLGAQAERHRRAAEDC